MKERLIEISTGGTLKLDFFPEHGPVLGNKKNPRMFRTGKGRS